jgi:hypothetical protein
MDLHMTHHGDWDTGYPDVLLASREGGGGMKREVERGME